MQREEIQIQREGFLRPRGGVHTQGLSFRHRGRVSDIKLHRERFRVRARGSNAKWGDQTEIDTEMQVKGIRHRDLFKHR